MPKYQSSLRVSLFYSYSHKDTKHKNNMEKTLSTLRQQGLLKDWSDAQIIPGQRISDALQDKLPDADIIAFLFSPDFLASEECLKEWSRSKELASQGRLVFRVPIILRECSWQDFLGDDDVKALPSDGKAVATYEDRDAAWQEVYNGIKAVVNALRTTYTAKPAFLDDLNSADIPSSKPISLDDIFVFPSLIQQDYTSASGHIKKSNISSLRQLHNLGSSIIHGQDRSGKTALAKHLVQSLIANDQPVVFADLHTSTNRPRHKLLRKLYEEQFHGDYHLWKQQQNKTLIIDNMSEAPGLIDFIQDCSETFTQIYIFISSDIFHSYFRDEIRLADFHNICLDPLTHTKQEQLIRKVFHALKREDTLADGFVDQVEDRVNSIIITNKIVPRYPFFVIAILQTYDTLMPHSLSITSYGHCYYIFILASLSRAGISESDEAVNACINFAEQLALETFLAQRELSSNTVDFIAFQDKYNSRYFIEKSLLSRLTHNEYGIISTNGEFKNTYMYYYFLGKLLATDAKLSARYLPELCEHSYEDGNYFILLFAIHHATDNEIIEDILIRMIVELENVTVATLNKDETSKFDDIVAGLPKSVLSNMTVAEERMKEREEKDTLEAAQHNASDKQPEKRKYETAPPIELLRVFKNNRILGQVLRNQSGKLLKSQIEEIVETIAESSFKLISVALQDKEEIRTKARYINAKVPEADPEKVQQMLKIMSFLWTMAMIEQAVYAVNVPSIREAVNAVVERHSTPVYDIFGYFCRLDSGTQLTYEVRDQLAHLRNMYDRDPFIKRVLSLRTQWYMNTHHIKPSLKQSICSVLGIRYKELPPPS